VAQGRKEILGMHEADVAKVLSRMGLLERMNAGDLHCSDCGGVLSVDTLGAIFKKDGITGLRCDRCLRMLLGFGECLDAE